jgi:hypothetical protein
VHSKIERKRQLSVIGAVKTYDWNVGASGPLPSIALRRCCPKGKWLAPPSLRTHSRTPKLQSRPCGLSQSTPLRSQNTRACCICTSIIAATEVATVQREFALLDAAQLGAQKSPRQFDLPSATNLRHSDRSGPRILALPRMFLGILPSVPSRIVWIICVTAWRVLLAWPGRYRDAPL